MNVSLQKMMTLKTTLENYLSQLEGFNETRSWNVMFAGRATHKSEQAKNLEFVPVTINFVISVL